MSITINEFLSQVEVVSREFADSIRTEALDIATNEALFSAAQRIFTENKDSNGNALGELSKTPIYVSKDKFVRKSAFKAQGINGLPKRGAKKPKTMYLAGGYDEFKKIQGRVYKLELTGKLKASYNRSEVINNKTNIGFISEDEGLKADGLDKIFDGKGNASIFILSSDDLEKFNESVKVTIQKKFDEIFR